MANLYLWFPNETERRKFLSRLLEIDPIKPRNKSKKAREEAESLQEDLDLAIWKLESGKTKGRGTSCTGLFYMAGYLSLTIPFCHGRKRLCSKKGFEAFTLRSPIIFARVSG